MAILRPCSVMTTLSPVVATCRSTLLVCWLRSRILMSLTHPRLPSVEMFYICTAGSRAGGSVARSGLDGGHVGVTLSCDGATWYGPVEGGEVVVGQGDAAGGDVLFQVVHALGAGEIGRAHV